MGPVAKLHYNWTPQTIRCLLRLLLWSIEVTILLHTCILREQGCPGLCGRFLQFQQQVSPWETQQPANCSAALCCWAGSYCVDSWCPLWLLGACCNTLNTSPAGLSTTDREHRVKHNHSPSILANIFFFLHNCHCYSSERWAGHTSLLSCAWLSRKMFMCWVSSSFSLISCSQNKDSKTWAIGSKYYVADKTF